MDKWGRCTNDCVSKGLVAETFIRIAREAFEADPVAVTRMVEDRVECNGKLADHPTIQVFRDEVRGKDFVGLVGMLNGILEPLANMKIAAVYDDSAPNDLAGFALIPVGGATSGKGY